MTERAPKILCAGIAVHDIVMSVESFPQPGEKVYASEFIVTGGGCAANASVAVARLGGSSHFAGPLGGKDDEISNRILNDLAAENVDCSRAVRLDGATPSVSLILLDKDGEKVIATRRGAKLETVSPPDSRRDLEGIDALLIDNRFPEFVMPLCRAAQARNMPLVIDLDQATQPDNALLKTGSHVIASAEGLRGTTGVNDLIGALEKLRAHLPNFLAVTDGPNGVYWMEGNSVRHLPAFKVDAIDSLGAGDAFHGAFTLALAEGTELLAAMRFASATAALKCTRFGGASGAPKRAEVQAFLKERG